MPKQIFRLPKMTNHVACVGSGYFENVAVFIECLWNLLCVEIHIGCLVEIAM